MNEQNLESYAQLHSKSANLSLNKSQGNKTKEDLQNLLNQIPYPQDDDLSLTSFSNTSANATPQKYLQQQQAPGKNAYQNNGKDNKIFQSQNFMPIDDPENQYQEQYL